MSAKYIFLDISKDQNLEQQKPKSNILKKFGSKSN